MGQKHLAVLTGGSINESFVLQENVCRRVLPGSQKRGRKVGGGGGGFTVFTMVSFHFLSSYYFLSGFVIFWHGSLLRSHVLTQLEVMKR